MPPAAKDAGVTLAIRTSPSVSRSFSTRPCHQVAKKARVNPPNATKLAKSQPMVAISGLVLSRSDHQDPSRGANTNAGRIRMLYKACSLDGEATRTSEV